MSKNPTHKSVSGQHPNDDIKNQGPTPNPSKMESAEDLLCARVVRERSQQLFNLALQNKLDHFTLHLENLDRAADETIQVIRHQYPGLDIPFHSRLRHLHTGGSERYLFFKSAIEQTHRPDKKSPTDKTPLHSEREALKSWVEWTIVSVLLDAGAGHRWTYGDPKFGGRYGRSEGLGIASAFMYLSGMFSLTPQTPLCVHGERLMELSLKDLSQGFQADPVHNPLEGLEGRLSLLNRLGKLVKDHRGFQDFAPQDSSPSQGPWRLGDLLDLLAPASLGKKIQARELLTKILKTLGPIWPGRIVLEGQNLGDTWRHSRVRARGPTDGLISFHKLSQWLTYSLLDVFREAGFTLEGLDELTGLPEYRNGGLMIDCQILKLRDPSLAHMVHPAGSELIVEWRALTVALLDLLADKIRSRLGLRGADLPLVKILEGGTWACGRKMAQALRPGGISPLRLESDGTVF